VIELRCGKAPAGWRCTRAINHDGPCAAEPDDSSVVFIGEGPPETWPGGAALTVARELKRRTHAEGERAVHELLSRSANWAPVPHEPVYWARSVQAARRAKLRNAVAWVGLLFLSAALTWSVAWVIAARLGWLTW
jgi:hypothetical protein